MRRDWISLGWMWLCLGDCWTLEWFRDIDQLRISMGITSQQLKETR
jgi:hypothetical protein